MVNGPSPPDTGCQRA